MVVVVVVRQEGVAGQQGQALPLLLLPLLALPVRWAREQHQEELGEGLVVVLSAAAAAAAASSKAGSKVLSGGP